MHLKGLHLIGAAGVYLIGLQLAGVHLTGSMS
jgi:hypothetical protein